MFTGLIYNDIFSKPINLFYTAWTYKPDKSVASQNGVYLFGIDTEWHHAENGLIFINSYKMKMSIILGVTQMTLGIVLTYFNHIQLGHFYSIYLEFIPQLLFMLFIFRDT